MVCRISSCLHRLFRLTFQSTLVSCTAFQKRFADKCFIFFIPSQNLQEFLFTYFYTLDTSQSKTSVFHVITTNLGKCDSESFIRTFSDFLFLAIRNSVPIFFIDHCGGIWSTFHWKYCVNILYLPHSRSIKLIRNSHEIINTASEKLVLERH